MRKPRLIYYNDSRHYLMYRFDPPMSLHRLRQPVDEVLGTGVDTLSYALASGDTFLHGTEVGYKWGQTVKEHNSGVMWWRAAENIVKALEAGHDPLKIVVDRAHEKGIQIICSARMNNTGTQDAPNQYMVGRLKWEKPDVVIGEEDPSNPRTATAYDYARPEVREHRLALIEEVCDRYGADGFEMDFGMGVFFKPSEVREKTPVMTDFVREARELLDRIGKKRGEWLCLAARIEPSEEANLSAGLDVRTWLSEGLLNLVVPQYDGWILDTNPWLGWLPQAAHKTGAWVYVPMGRTPYDDRDQELTIEMYRAAATNYRINGADGLYLADLPWPHTEGEYMVMREMGDPDLYARKSKHYILGLRDPSNGKQWSRRYIPETLQEGQSVRVPVSVGDNLDSARADRELDRTVLGVRIVQTCPEDRLVFRFNGSELPLDKALIKTYYGGLVSYSAQRSGLPHRINTHYWFEFDLPLDLVQEGENEVEVTMERHFKALTADRVLQNIELRVTYKEPPIPVGGQM